MDATRSVEDDQISELFSEVWHELNRKEGPPPINKASHFWDSLSLLGLSSVVYVLFML